MTGLVAVAVVVITDVEVDALATVARVAGLGPSRLFLYISIGRRFLFVSK